MKDDQFKLTDIDHIMDLMDFDKSDSIDLNEFFEVHQMNVFVFSSVALYWSTACEL